MQKSVVIYDADCGICEKCINLLKKLDWLKRLEYYPLQDSRVYLTYSFLNLEDCQKEMKLIEGSPRESSDVSGGGDAVRRICLKLPLLMPLGVLMWLPPFRQLVRRFYPLFANNRYRISSRCGIGNRPKS